MNSRRRFFPSAQFSSTPRRSRTRIIRCSRDFLGSHSHLRIKKFNDRDFCEWNEVRRVKVAYQKNWQLLVLFRPKSRIRRSKPVEISTIKSVWERKVCEVNRGKQQQREREEKSIIFTSRVTWEWNESSTGKLNELDNRVIVLVTLWKFLSF